MEKSCIFGIGCWIWRERYTLYSHVCRKLCHLIWGIWQFHRSKDFEAMKAGKSAIFLFSGGLIWLIYFWTICPWNKFEEKAQCESLLCKNFILQNLTHCKQKHGLFGCQQNTFHCLQGKRLELDLYWSFAVKSQQTHHDQSWKISSKILEDLQG